MPSPRVVETFTVPETGTKLWAWASASWRTFAPPDAFYLALDRAVPVSHWHKGPVPAPPIEALIPTLRQVSGLKHILVDTRPHSEWDDLEPLPWNHRVVLASLSNRYYCHLPVQPETADSDAQTVREIVAAGRTPVLFSSVRMNIAPFINILIASGVSVRELEWEDAPHSQGGK